MKSKSKKKVFEYRGSADHNALKQTQPSHMVRAHTSMGNPHMRSDN